MAEQAANTNVPFETLREIEKRSLVHAVGLPEQSLVAGTWSGIAFRLAGANLVCEIGEIVEILTIPGTAPVPGSKFWVVGMANVRGTLVPIVDLRAFLSGERTQVNKHTRVLVAIQHGGTVGLLIDEIAGQRHFIPDERTEAGHYAEHMTAPFIKREFEKGGEYWAALDIDKLVNSAEFMQAAA